MEGPYSWTICHENRTLLNMAPEPWLGCLGHGFRAAPSWHLFGDHLQLLFYARLMKIRKIKPEDFQEWFSLWDGYNSFYKRSIPAEVTEKTWSRFLDPNEPVYALAAEVNGKILGFTAYLFHRHTAMVNEVCYLQDLFTDESVRGQGIGKSLILSVYENAKARGSIQVYWMTQLLVILKPLCPNSRWREFLGLGRLRRRLCTPRDSGPAEICKNSRYLSCNEFSLEEAGICISFAAALMSAN